MQTTVQEPRRRVFTCRTDRPGFQCYTQRVTLLLASANNGKVQEVRRILGEYGIDMMGLASDAQTTGIEIGESYSENALLKARHFHARTGLITIADDSGLEVSALDDRPGVHSARYAGAGATDRDRIQKLLREMEHVPTGRRDARFVCAAAIAWEGGERVFAGSVTGRILTEPSGVGGFGFDPLFHYEALDRTFAELSEEDKSRVSHRGQAFRCLALWLRESRESGLLDTTGMGDRMGLPKQ